MQPSLRSAQGENTLLDVDLTFPNSYDIEEVRESPGTGRSDVPVFYVPQPKNRPEHDGLWLRIRPQNDSQDRRSHALHPEYASISELACTQQLTFGVTAFRRIVSLLPAIPSATPR